MKPFRLAWAKIVASLVVICVGAWIDFGSAATDTLLRGKLASMQFDPSDASALAYGTLSGTPSASGWLVTLAVAGLLFAIWVGPLCRKLGVFAVLALALGAAGAPEQARAYYNQSDYAEPFFILPNESAFFIPDTGDNLQGQGSFGSEQYLERNKIAAKRFTIPHAKLPGSGLWSNYYVPAGRLIVVDRTPFSREWVSASDRGSSAHDEGFHCQSSEGLDVTVGVAIGSSVYEQDAAKFLFHFGVKPPVGDRTQPEVIFTSVYYGRSLIEVMDGPVRNKVQSLVCGQLSSHTLDYDNQQASAIQAAVEKDTRDYLGNVGITLDYFGWADTFTFDPKVQDAINRIYVAKADAAIADNLKDKVQVIQGLAVATAVREKWNGAGPAQVSLWWMPESLTGAMGRLFGGLVPSAAPAQSAK